MIDMTTKACQHNLSGCILVWLSSLKSEQEKALIVWTPVYTRGKDVFVSLPICENDVVHVT